MICPRCAREASTGNRKHGPQACAYPKSCTCQHGRNIEQDPEDPTVPAYIDALPPDHPDRLDYEKRVGRKIS